MCGGIFFCIRFAEGKRGLQVKLTKSEKEDGILYIMKFFRKNNDSKALRLPLKLWKYKKERNNFIPPYQHTRSNSFHECIDYDAETVVKGDEAENSN